MSKHNKLTQVVLSEIIGTDSKVSKFHQFIHADNLLGINETKELKECLKLYGKLATKNLKEIVDMSKLEEIIVQLRCRELVMGEFKLSKVRDYIYAGNRHSRHDLFQIYFPKGTKVEEWIVAVPALVGEDLERIFDGIKRPYSMMEFSKILNNHFVTKYGFRNAMYPCKNAARHIAMSHPEWVDPDTFLHGGTGFFDGLVQIFDCPHYMSKAKYEIDAYGNYNPTNNAGVEFVNHMVQLHDHPDMPIHTHKYLNLEDKLCMHYKYMAMKFGFKKQTKQIPYNWVYPDNWSLRTGTYDS